MNRYDDFFVFDDLAAIETALLKQLEKNLKQRLLKNNDANTHYQIARYRLFWHDYYGFVYHLNEALLSLKLNHVCRYQAYLALAHVYLEGPIFDLTMAREYFDFASHYFSVLDLAEPDQKFYRNVEIQLLAFEAMPTPSLQEIYNIHSDEPISELTVENHKIVSQINPNQMHFSHSNLMEQASILDQIKIKDLKQEARRVIYYALTKIAQDKLIAAKSRYFFPILDVPSLPKIDKLHLYQQHPFCRLMEMILGYLDHGQNLEFFVQHDQEFIFSLRRSWILSNNIKFKRSYLRPNYFEIKPEPFLRSHFYVIFNEIYFREQYLPTHVHPIRSENSVENSSYQIKDISPMDLELRLADHLFV